MAGAIDGLVYPGAVAIGFSALESMLLIDGHSFTEQLARAAVGPAVHSVFAMIWGYGLAHSVFSVTGRLRRALWQVVPLGAAMALHGLYDFALVGYGATLAASLGIGALWVVMVIGSRRLLAADKARAAGAAPWRPNSRCEP